jgi:hypothetical protein
MSPNVETYPPLPPKWRLDLDPMEEFLLVVPDGRGVPGSRIYIAERNLFTPTPVSPRVQAAIDAMEFGQPPPLPPVQPPTAEEAADTIARQWLVHVPERFPEHDETREEYFKRVAKHMRKELKGQAWTAGHIGNELYRLGLIKLRQPRRKKSQRSLSQVSAKSQRTKS